MASSGELDYGGIGEVQSCCLPEVSIVLLSTWTIPLAKFSKTDLTIQLRAMQSPGPIQKHHSFSDGIRESCFKAPALLFKPAGMVCGQVKARSSAGAPPEKGQGRGNQPVPPLSFSLDKLQALGAIF